MQVRIGRLLISGLTREQAFTLIDKYGPPREGGPCLVPTAQRIDLDKFVEAVRNESAEPSPQR